MCVNVMFTLDLSNIYIGRQIWLYVQCNVSIIERFYCKDFQQVVVSIIAVTRQQWQVPQFATKQVMCSHR